MKWIIKYMKWIMIVSGMLTCTVLYAAVAPQAALQSMFGESLDGALAEIIVRNWGVLVGLVGIMLIYGALHPAQRFLILSVAGVSKVIFISLVLSLGSQYLSKAGITLMLDGIFVILFVIYLIGTIREQPAK